MNRTTARFWNKVEKSEDPGGCWLWTASPGSKGYGQFHLDGGPVPAHRAAWILTHGSIAPGLVVRHQCHRPGCVRPDHLALGTQLDNIQDAISAGRHTRGERSSQAKLTEADVVAMREARAAGEPVKALADLFAVSDVLVSQVCTGKAWAHVGGPVRESRRARGSMVTPVLAVSL